MPSFVFTANAGTDQLHIVAHGLNTGDGPGAGRNLGGALPSPLAGVTDYWIIRDDADHVRLATSSANALAGTAIDLTDTGSGTNYLEVGIPYRRARTYVASSVSVPGAQVKSVDLNAIQDALDALHALLTGQAQSTWSDVKPGEKSLPITGGDYTNLTVLTIGLTSTSGAWAFTSQMIDLPVGKTIRFYRVVWTKTGVTPTNYKLFYYPPASAGAHVPAFVVMDSGSFNTAGYQDVTAAVVAPIPIAAGTRWHIAMDTGDAGDVVLQLEVFWT